MSGGVSNISFSFRGNNAVREAMHSAFLYHAIRAGMDMGIVNAGQLGIYEEIPPELRERVEDVLLNRRADATERLLEFAQTVEKRGPAAVREDAWRQGTVEERLSHALVHGITEFIAAGRRGGAAEISLAADYHRRAADGRHEYRGRPVWFGEDVFAASGEERAGDEAGRGDSAALSGGGKAGQRRAAGARRAF